MQSPQLSTGALTAALISENFTQYPITLQVLEVNAIQPKDGSSSGGTGRYKIVVSDGRIKCSALLASQLKGQVESGTLTEGSIIDVLELVGNKRLQSNTNYNLNNKKLLIFLNIMVKGFYAPTIGDPQPFKALEAAAVPPAGLQPRHGGLPGQQCFQGAYGQHPPMQSSYGQPPPLQSSYSAGASSHPDSGVPTSVVNQMPYSHGSATMYNACSMYGGGSHGSTYGAPPQAMYGGPRSAPAQHGGGTGPIALDDAPVRILPIKALNPYQSRWTIKARCTSKSEVRRWSNARGEGKLFHFDLLDREGGEIRVTAWKDQVEKYYNLVEVGRVYQLGKASLKNKQAKFNATKHEYEITLEANSELLLCEEDGESFGIPDIQYHFKKINSLETVEAGSVVDVIGILDHVEGWQIITKKNGDETKKRSISLRDDTNRSIEITLWGEYAANPGEQLETEVKSGRHPVLAVKGARVGDFNGKTLSTISSTQLRLSPDLQEAVYLMEWFTGGGGAQTVKPLSDSRLGGMGKADRRVLLSTIKEEGLGTHGQPEWVSMTGTVNFIRNENMYYASCMKDFNGRTCMKKLNEQSPGSWWCERCSANCNEPFWRYLLSLSVMDHTGSQWLTAFGEAGDLIMGLTAAELRMLDNAQFEQVLQESTFRTFHFRIKVAEDTYGDERRVKVSIAGVKPINYVQEGYMLLNYIQCLDRGHPIMQHLGVATGGTLTSTMGLPRTPADRGGALGRLGPRPYGTADSNPPYSGKPGSSGGGGRGSFVERWTPHLAHQKGDWQAGASQGPGGFCQNGGAGDQPFTSGWA